jgi:hypothetical protein
MIQNLMCHVAYCIVILQGLPFFAENTATTDIYVNMLELIALLQIDDNEQEEGKILFL